MIRFRQLAFALALCCASLSVAGAPAAEPTAGQVVGALGMGQVFARFGASIAPGPRQGGLSDERFLGLWERIIPAAFAGPALVDELGRDVASGLHADELQVVSDFTASGLGQRIRQIEASSAGSNDAAQIDAIARGQVLLLQMTPSRRAMLSRVLELSGARTTVAMLHESLRAVALALHLQRRGVVASYEEVDAEIGASLSALDDSLAGAMLGALASAYAPVGDAELSAYVEQLGQPAMRKFQTVVTESACRIIRRTMLEAVKDVVAYSRAVNI